MPNLYLVFASRDAAEADSRVAQLNSDRTSSNPRTTKYTEKMVHPTDGRIAIPVRDIDQAALLTGAERSAIKDCQWLDDEGWFPSHYPRTR